MVVNTGFTWRKELMCAHAMEHYYRPEPYQQQGYQDNFYSYAHHNGQSSTDPHFQCCLSDIPDQELNHFAECVSDCPLLPIHNSDIDSTFGTILPEPCPSCDPSQPAVPLGSFTHSIHPSNNENGYICAHSVLLHNHNNHENIHLSHGHVQKPRPSTPVQKLAQELAEECEHFLRPDECYKCSRTCDSVPLSDCSDEKSYDSDVKKIRNKEAAQKYRNKIKSRFSTLVEEEKKLATKNLKLQKVVGELDAQVQWYRRALLENASEWKRMVGLDQC
ncbi:unnamed protein product, partial [Mesorhabditis spiculigera]